MTTPHDPDPTTAVPTPVAPEAPAAPATPGPVWSPTPAAAAGSTAPVGASPEAPAAPAVTIPTQPVVVAAAPRRSRSGTILNVVLAAALAVAVGGVAFAVGRSTAPASAAAANGGLVTNGTGNGQFGGPRGSFTPGQGGPTFGGPGLGGGLSVLGTVTAIDGDTMTVKTAAGDEVAVKLDTTTTYHTATDATVSDVTVGSSVDVQVTGGGRFTNGNGNGNSGNGNGNGGTRQLTAGDVTVRQ